MYIYGANHIEAATSVQNLFCLGKMLLLMIRKDPQNSFFLAVKLSEIWISMRVNFAHHLSACTDSSVH